MFLDYRKPSKELVIDLINRDNPNLPFPITYENCNIVSPVAVNEPSKYGFRNTEVTIVPHDKVNWRGPTRVAYRRLEAKDLFPGGKVLLTDYSANTTIAKAEYIDSINDKYGTCIDLSELTSVAIASTVHNGNFVFTTGCLAYVGNIPYSRLQPLIPISSKIPNIVNDWLPTQPVGGVDYTAVLYAADFTPFDHLIEGAGNTFQNNQFAQPLCEVMSVISGVKFGPGTSRPMDTASIRATIYTLPNSTIPSLSLANTKYSKVMLIMPLNANSWLKGSLYLHFDKD